MKTGDTKDGKLVIVQISSDSPAQNAGMRAGDVITAVNGRKMSNDEFYAFMHFNRGENVSFKTKRNGVEIEHAVQPEKIFSAPPSAVKVKELLYIDKRKVRIAVIVGDVRNSMEGNFDRRSWEASFRNQHQDQIENGLSRNFADAKNFSLVDRRRLDTILDEHTVRLSELASEDARTHIGKTTGATHLFIANIARHPESRHGNYCVDEYHHQLIDIESGKVLAIDRQENEACR